MFCFPKKKKKINNITQPLNQFIKRKSYIQSTKIICRKRFSVLLSIYDVNISNDWINPEFVVIRKEFKFTVEIFYLGVNKFKYIGNCFGQRFSLNTFKKILWTKNLMNFSVNWVSSILLVNLSSIGNFETCMLLQVTSKNFVMFFIYFSYVSFPESKIPISFKITVTQNFLQVMTIMLAALLIRTKAFFVQFI